LEVCVVIQANTLEILSKKTIQANK